MALAPFVSATEAAAELGIRLPTLYAYVSRGLIRSEPAGGTHRERRYHREDVQRLKEQKEQRRHPAQVAVKALHWGAPVLDSELTMIADGRLYYRGWDAVEMATSHTIEQVAALLWTGDLTGSTTLFPPTRMVDLAPFHSVLNQTQAPLIARMQMALAMAEESDPATHDLRPSRVAQSGAAILHLLTSVAVGRRIQGDVEIAETLQRGWAPKISRAARLMSTALVLCADHELNVSSFTARCVASARATPYSAVIAALSALQGIRHGGDTRQVQALFQEISTPANARRVLSSRLKRGETIPGFGHVLYPEGDPRARLLIQLAETALPRSRHILLGKAIVRQVTQLLGEYPNIDFAIVLLARALDLPEDGALGLFALGRTAGWIAHVIEQYQQPALIRPRARYVGPLPGARTVKREA
jgi:citrate synthase